MAVVANRDGAVTPEPPLTPGQQQANAEAAKLLKVFNAAKPANPDEFIPGQGMPGGGDIPRPTGLYSYALTDDVWPSESESELFTAANRLAELAAEHDAAATNAAAQSDQVFTGSWAAGDGATAAQAHYQAEHGMHLRLARILGEGAAGVRRLGDDIGRIKQRMRTAHDDAHLEIETFLESGGGITTAQVAVILTQYRTLVAEYSTEMRGFVASETTMLGNEFPLSPPAGGEKKGTDLPSDDGPKDGTMDDETDRGLPGSGMGNDLPTSKPGAGDDGAGPTPHDMGNAPPTPSPAQPQISQLPELPQMPQTPSFDGATSPLSGAAQSGMSPLSGLMGTASQGTGPASGLANSTSNLANPTVLQNQTTKAMTQALGGEFGRGLAAGASVAGGGMPPVGGAPPQPPSTPLAAPSASITPASAAPASAGTPLAPSLGGTASSTAIPATASAAPATPMTPYGSVLPPAPPAGMAASGASGGSMPPPSPAIPPAGGNAATAAGFLPAVRDTGPARIDRDVSMTDLEAARSAVADLAAASSVIYPGLEWAVVVARGASGLPEMWVTTNEGAGYIPQGVYLPRAMPLAAGFDLNFDSRWFGWFNPAETALRAVKSRGDAVSAVATTWVHESDEVKAATEDVATGVAPTGRPADADASELTRARSHRLETVNPTLFHDLNRADQSAVDAYVREITQQVAFGPGPELSVTAQTIARTLIAAHWPSVADWEALRTEYESARLMAGSQRPGLLGIEEPAQLVTYQGDFVHCRRLEALLCWDTGTPADVVYGAHMAGITAPTTGALA